MIQITPPSNGSNSSYIGEYVTAKIPNLNPHHSNLEYPKGSVICEDGLTYNIDPLLNVLVALQLHYCCRHGLDADNVFNTVVLMLTVPGCFQIFHDD